MSTRSRFSVLTSVLVGLASITPVAAQHSGHTHTPPSAASSTAALPLVVQNPTVVAVPPSITETSAFMTVKNTGKAPIRLVGVKADIAGHVMFMKTIKQQNMMGMLPVNEFVVPAGGTLVMQHDGNHVMLMKLKRALKVGEVIPIVLQASDGRSVTVKATVKKP